MASVNLDIVGIDFVKFISVKFIFGITYFSF